ncbi:MAG: hypothetical protein LKF31_06400 [Muribaculaceae bacterium]|jgi:hypothetical protein|nr:hypothetical protein [Muribaculaceae bacterium]
MIHPDSRTTAWIEKVAEENHVREKVLIEKAIRAFSLLRHTRQASHFSKVERTAQWKSTSSFIIFWLFLTLQKI